MVDISTLKKRLSPSLRIPLTTIICDASSSSDDREPKEASKVRGVIWGKNPVCGLLDAKSLSLSSMHWDRELLF